MTIIVGIMGAAGAGKSTAASRLVARYGARRYSFAGPLKELAIATLGFTHEQCYGSQAAKEAVDPRYGFSARQYLQWAGKAARDTFGDDFWIKQAIAAIVRDKPQLAVIDDCRYMNEATAIRNLGSSVRGYVWRLDAPNPDSIADATHPSETEWREAEFDRLLMPGAMGNSELFALVDDAARACVLFPVRREVAL